MYTIKQLEAFCASAALGSFAAASKRLNTSQSTVAKRIVELEAIVGTPLFDRSVRRLQLTHAGQRLLGNAQQMMELHGRITQSMTDLSRFQGRLRIGATDLVGLTWLPSLIRAIREQFPLVEIEPEIDHGVRLYERLDRDEIDIAFMPGPFSSPGLEARFLGRIENAWMASPALELGAGVLSPADVSALPIIGQPANSALTLLYRDWFAANGFASQRVLSCNSLGMVANLTVEGLGLSYLPRRHFAPLVAAGQLREVAVNPALPWVSYFAFFKRSYAPPPIEQVLAIVAEVGRFDSAEA